jgi:hypothetical protein
MYYAGELVELINHYPLCFIPLYVFILSDLMILSIQIEENNNH